ncbi:MAG TPA: ATP-dependent RNA helicase DbpA [Xanthomonadales bacterium]|nr:ATP-dependent RNA helicase DbpA [Xanthomonadales bacterium]
MPADQFSTLPISSELVANLESLGFKKMTPIQAKSLPHVLGGRDLIARAKTGSGKTAAFGIGIIQSINPRFFGVQALILCPTRELAEQVGKELRRLARSTPNIKLVLLCGGKPFGPQRGSLQHGAHIAVGTPGRVQDHLRRNTLKLDGLKTLVLDEADRMLDMGFADDMTAIISRTPKKRQTLLFSATYPEGIRKISRSVQRDPVTVTVDETHQQGVIEQLFFEVTKEERNDTLLALFRHHKPASTLVFCFTKKHCDLVAKFLRGRRIDALAIHGDLEQRERDQVLVQFANQSCPVLVATDVAARGLDIKSLQAVINYELPRDPEVYVHRIGRTGRAGEEGMALSLFTEAEAYRVRLIEEYLQQPCVFDVPASLEPDSSFRLTAPMVTIEIDSGRKQKIRPGDLLGALTGDAGLPGKKIGKIDIFEMNSFVAIQRDAVEKALSYMANGKVKARNVRARKLR